MLAALFFTTFMRFVNLRMFKHAIQVVRGKFSDPNDQGEVSHFQALSSALSATVGLGNIAGVAIAVSIGGPGATFWMIVAGLLGMTLKFTECTLGQKFRHIDSEGMPAVRVVTASPEPSSALTTNSTIISSSSITRILFGCGGCRSISRGADPLRAAPRIRARLR